MYDLRGAGMSFGRGARQATEKEGWSGRGRERVRTPRGGEGGDEEGGGRGKDKVGD
jgi:hypothetical protein